MDNMDDQDIDECKPIVIDEFIITDESKPIITDEGKLIIFDESTLITTDESKPIITDEGELIIFDESTLITTDESKPIITDEGKLIIFDESTLITTDESEPIITDEFKPIIIDESTAIITDESTSIITNECKPMIIDENKSIIDKSKPIIIESKTITKVNNCNCVIEYLLKNIFVSLPNEEKEIIFNSPKPTPKLNIQSYNKMCTRRFNDKIYERVPWICGCAHLSQLFCWPCILFSQEVNVWDKYGYSDLNNISNACKRHECSQSHICSTIQFKRFEKKRTGNINFQLKANIENHNREVTANRYIVTKLISVICFLVKQELPLGEHFGINESENRDNHIKLLHILSNSDITLKIHLDYSTALSEISNHIQNDLISSISNALIDNIKSEIRASKFISIIVDESADIDCKGQLSTVFRYVDKYGDIQERFVGFTNVSPDRTADALFNHIFNTLKEFECLDKVIAQTYDGAAVKLGEHNKVQKKIQNICPNSLFVHCYAHRLSFISSQSVSHIKECKLFFKHVLSFSYFFRKSPERMTLLDCEIKKRCPIANPMQWSNNINILNNILEYRKELMKIFMQIMENEDEWNTDTVIYAKALSHHLNDFEFNFNLHLFPTIFDSADTLFDILQKNTFDIKYCSKEIKKFEDFLNDKKNDFDSLWNKVIIENLNRKRKDAISEENMRIRYANLYSEILQAISVNITNRLRNIDNLRFMELFNVTKFRQYKKFFPDDLLTSLQNTFGKYFDKNKLRSELVYMYSSSDFELKSIHSIKESILKHDLKSILTELFRLIQLIFTIPSLSATVKESFSTMERIKMYTRNHQNEDRLSDLAIIFIDKFDHNLDRNDKFYDAVIDDFCEKEHEIKLKYKTYFLHFFC